MSIGPHIKSTLLYIFQHDILIRLVRILNLVSLATVEQWFERHTGLRFVQFFNVNPSHDLLLPCRIGTRSKAWCAS